VNQRFKMKCLLLNSKCQTYCRSDLHMNLNFKQKSDTNIALFIPRPILVFQVISICQIRLCSWISVKSRQNLHVQLSQVHGNYAMEYGWKQGSSSERSGKLFGREDGFKVMRIDFTIVTFPPTRVEVRMTSKSIRLGAKTSWPKPYHHIKGREVLGPMGLSSGE